MPSIPSRPVRTRVSPNKLLQSKWTAVQPREREKHFVVIRLVGPGELPMAAPSPAAARDLRVLLQAVYSKRTWTLPWRELTEPSRWRRGWL